MSDSDDILVRCQNWHAPSDEPHFDSSELIQEAAAEIARLRARPTEEEVAEIIRNRADTWMVSIPIAKDIARAVIAKFPKV